MSSTIWFEQTVLDRMREWADSFFPNEVGGMLMGYEAEIGDVVVREVIGPGPLATHRAMGFHPDSQYQQFELERTYAQSGGVNTYLGDWHTHPRGVGELSLTDRRTLTRIADKKYDCTNTPTMVILADGRDSRWDVVAHRIGKRVWRPWPTKTTIERLTVKLFHEGAT